MALHRGRSIRRHVPTKPICSSWIALKPVRSYAGSHAGRCTWQWTRPRHDIDGIPRVAICATSRFNNSANSKPPVGKRTQRKEELRLRIAELVAEYAGVAFAPAPFVPG